MKAYIILILSIFLLCVAVMCSGCTSDPGQGMDEGAVQEEQEADTDDPGDNSGNGSEIMNDAASAEEDSQAQESPLDEEVPVISSDITGYEDSEENEADSNDQQPVPQVSITASALGDGRYLLENKGNIGLDLTDYRLILSSEGRTNLYSPIAEDTVIMESDDRLLIDIASGEFSLNDMQISVTDPEVTDSSLGDTGIIFIHIDSGQIVSYITLSE